MLLARTEAPQQLSLAPEHQALHVHLHLLCAGRGPVRRPGPLCPRKPLASGHSPWSESERSEERPEESRLSARGRSLSPGPASPRSRSSCRRRLCCSLRSFSLSRRACCSCSSSFCGSQGSKRPGSAAWRLGPPPNTTQKRPWPPGDRLLQTRLKRLRPRGLFPHAPGGQPSCSLVPRKWPVSRRLDELGTAPRS